MGPAINSTTECGHTGLLFRVSDIGQFCVSQNCKQTEAFKTMRSLISCERFATLTGTELCALRRTRVRAAVLGVFQGYMIRLPRPRSLILRLGCIRSTVGVLRFPNELWRVNAGLSRVYPGVRTEGIARGTGGSVITVMFDN